MGGKGGGRDKGGQERGSMRETGGGGDSREGGERARI